MTFSEFISGTFTAVFFAAIAAGSVIGFETLKAVRNINAKTAAAMIEQGKRHEDNLWELAKAMKGLESPFPAKTASVRLVNEADLDGDREVTFWSPIADRDDLRAAKRVVLTKKEAHALALGLMMVGAEAKVEKTDAGKPSESLKNGPTDARKGSDDKPLGKASETRQNANTGA